MFEGRRFYYYLIFGALGGATGWFTGGLLAPPAGQLLAARTWLDAAETFQRAAFGCALGACIGLAIAAYDGLASRSPKRFFIFGSRGAALGLLAGGLALPLSQAAYARLVRAHEGDAIWAAGAFILCWTLFGGMIGLIEGIHKGTQSLKGFYGGLIGGLCGGALHYAALALPWMNRSDNMKQLSLAISLVLMGGAIGAAVIFVTVKFRQAYVEIVNGKRADDEDDVTKHVARRKGNRTKPGLIGSDSWGASVYLPGDKGVMPRHAEISFLNGAPTLTVLPEALHNSTTLVNGKRVRACPLKDGDRIQVGSTTLIYHQKRK